MNKQQRAAMQQALDLARECGATDRTVEYGKRMIVEFYTEQIEAFVVRIRADALPALVPTQDIPVCLNCIGQGWEPTVYGGRIPCGHCQPKELVRAHREQQPQPSIHAGLQPVDGDLSTRPCPSEREDFEAWLRTVCFQKPTPEAHDLARDAWKARAALAASQAMPRQMSDVEANDLCQNRTLLGGTVIDLLRDVERHHGITGAEPQGVEPSVDTPADAIQAAVLAERERCALVADAISNKYAYGFYGNEVDTADEIAAAIRKGPQ